MKMEKKGFIGSVIMLSKSRIEIIFATTWTTALATIIAGKRFPPIKLSFLTIVAMMMINLSIYIDNDIIDRDMDAHSKNEKKRGRPIAHGKVSVTNAKRVVYITGLLGLGLCWLINMNVFSIGLVYYVILLLYSYPSVRFKTMYIIKNLVTSLVPAATFIIGGIALENRISFSILFLALAYFILSFTVQPVIADMLDFEEDRAFNVKTLGNTLTWKQNLILFNIGLIVIILTGVISYQMFNVSFYAPLILSAICIPAMVYSYMLRNENRLTASYKLRPVGLVLILITPLTLALWSVF
jgi:4-hydroxybenzoate polyprenyltransferase